MRKDKWVAAKQGLRDHASPWITAVLLYFILAAGTIRLTSNGRDIATIWPANAVLLAMLMLGPRPAWGRVLSAGFCGNVAANLITRGTVWGPLLYSFSNLAEVALAAVLLRRARDGALTLESPQALGSFVLSLGVIAPLASALSGAATAALVFDQPFWGSFERWYLSDGLGLLVFTPLLFALLNGDLARSLAEKTAAQRGEALALQAMVVLCCWLIFFRTQPPLLFTLFAPVMLVTFRAGRIGTMIAVTLVAVIGAIGTIADTGPIAAFTQDHGQQALLFQLYLAFLLLTSLPVASVLSERNLRTQELVQSEKSALRLASTDSLTGLLNRPAFIASVERAFQAEGDRVFSLIIVDVDHFKQVNDCWGHMAGDRALVHIGGILARQCREHDTIARMGGDEFMLLLRDTPTDIAVAICERVSLTLRQASLDVDGKTKAILSISCGVASSRGHTSFEDVYGAADQALYHAKSAGRNRAVASASQILAG
jgi:diguanylate cyclase (GGDEF)-like protein